MDFGLEALLDQTPPIPMSASPVPSGESGRGRPALVGQLVRVLGAAFVGDQPSQPTFSEGGQRLIEGGSREAEGSRCAGHRMALALHSAKHLVLDLDEIPGIEEVVVGKQRIGDCAGPRIEVPCCCRTASWDPFPAYAKGQMAVAAVNIIMLTNDALSRDYLADLYI